MVYSPPRAFLIFLSTPSARRATVGGQHRRRPRSFLSTPSARRATSKTLTRIKAPWKISIHALREEGDMKNHSWNAGKHIFLSTPSARRATAASPARPTFSPNFYPRPPRGGRRRDPSAFELPCQISIHALREEGDLLRLFPKLQQSISIHALREEGDQRSKPLPAMPRPFLSTPSARRATMSAQLLRASL